MTGSFYGAQLIRTKYKWGMCLGRTIYIGETASERKLRHEFGHHLQWKHLGILYWFVIAVPSLLHALIWTMCNRRWEYHSFYTEAWANKLPEAFFKKENTDN